MSAEVIEMLARRWNCSLEDVGRAIGHRLAAAGLVDLNSTRTLTDAEVIDAQIVKHGKPAIWYTLGVTGDDRIFVLDADDNPVLEL